MGGGVPGASIYKGGRPHLVLFPSASRSPRGGGFCLAWWICVVWRGNIKAHGIFTSTGNALSRSYVCVLGDIDLHSVVQLAAVALLRVLWVACHACMVS